MSFVFALVNCVAFLWLLNFGVVVADYACFCNYKIEESAYSKPNDTSPIIGYIYEFDCKPLFGKDDGTAEFLAIQMDQKVLSEIK